MLSREEMRRLNEIERELQSTDPGLAERLRTMRRGRRWSVPLTVLGWIAFAATAAMGWWIVALLVFGPLIPLTVLAWPDG